MLPHYLPCRVSRGAATLPYRLPLRSIPPPRFACGASHSRDMGVHGLCGRVPDSAGNVSPWIESAQTDANLSAHLHRLPTPPPYLRQMRLSPGRGRRYPIGDKAVAWPGAAFLQITARTNPCSRHLWGILVLAVSSVCPRDLHSFPLSRSFDLIC